MPIDPNTLLSVGGKLLGGLFGRRKRTNSIQQIVSDAKAAGIHPLAALGSPAASSYGSPVGSSTTGDAIGDAISEFGRSRKQDKLQGKQDRLIEAQIDTEKAKADALRAEARSRTMISSARGTGQKPIPLWVEYVDRDGNVQWGPNPDIPDLEQMPVPGMIHGTDAIVGDEVPSRIVDGRRVLVRPRPRPSRESTGAGKSRGSIRW